MSRDPSDYAGYACAHDPGLAEAIGRIQHQDLVGSALFVSLTHGMKKTVAYCSGMLYFVGVVLCRLDHMGGRSSFGTLKSSALAMQACSPTWEAEAGEEDHNSGTSLKTKQN